MALTTRTRTAQAARAQATTSWQLWSWYFMRISGIVLVFLVLGHFTIVHLLDEGIDRVNFAFVAGRWASPFWQTWDWTMLFLGMLHGANGVKNIMEEYVRSPGRRATYKALLYLMTFIFILLGTLVILTFNPEAALSS